MSLRDWVIYTTGADGRVTWRTVSVEELHERRMRSWARRVGRIKDQYADEEDPSKIPPLPNPPRAPA